MASSDNTRQMQIALAIELDNNNGIVSAESKRIINALTPFEFHKLVAPFRVTPHRDSKKYDSFNIEKFERVYRTRYIINNECILHVYVRIGYLDGIKKIANTSSYTFGSYFDMACEYGHLNIVRYFQSVGCFHPESGFLTAAAFGHLDVVKYLEPFVTEDKTKSDSMYWACRNRKHNIIEYLVREAKISVVHGFRAIHPIYDHDELYEMMGYLLNLDPSDLNGKLFLLLENFDLKIDNTLAMAIILIKRGARFSDYHLDRINNNPELRELQELKAFC